MGNWKKVRLGDILTESKIESISPSNETRIRVLLNAKGVIQRPVKKELERATKYFIRKKGQFIYGKQNIHKGAFGIIPDDLDGFESTSDLPAFDVDESCLPIWIDFFLKQGNYYLNLVNIARGAATKRVQPREFLELKIPLPSLSEQQKIVAYFKSIETEDGALKTELNHQQTLLKKLRQQILQEAIEGKLTADWRAQHSPPLEGWQAKPDGVVHSPPLEGCPKGGVVHSRNTKNYLKLPFNSELKQRAKELRKAGNLSEVLFWNQVKHKQFQGLDFDRQKIIGNYIVDFYCANFQVVIEIDGSSHDGKQDYDRQRDAYLEGLGLTVIHVLDADIKNNLDGVMRWLCEHEAFQPPRQASPATPPEEEPPRPSGTPPEEGNWESASELLARIQAEKERLVKEGKIKKQKPLPPISEDEKPFALPEGWAWCRLGEISINSLGKMLDAQKNKGEPKPYLRNLNVQWFRINTSDLKEMPFEDHETDKYSVFKGDVVICEGGYPGQAAIWERENSIMFQKALHRVRFILQCFPSSLFVQMLWLWDADGSIKYYFTGAGIKHLTGRSLNKILIPLPPLLEQKAIVAKVEKLLALCDQLETQITTNQTHADGLMQAVLKEAFSHNSAAEPAAPAPKATAAGDLRR